MKLLELIGVLHKNPEASLKITLPTGEPVPDHFHVTEVGQVTKRFIDCGGMVRSSDACVLQVWIANDFDHRLTSTKLAKILTLAEWRLKIDNNLPVEIEYEGGTISQYPLLSVEEKPEGLAFITGMKHTDCLAKDKCGVAGCC